MIEAYLLFDGNCREAVEFYAKVFNTEKTHFMTYEEGHQNNPIPEEAKNRIMHTNLNICGSRMMFSDVFPARLLHLAIILQLLLFMMMWIL